MSLQVIKARIEILEAKLSERDRVNSAVDKASEELNAFVKDKRLPNGLVPNEVRVSPEYRKLKSNFDIAFKKLQEFNKKNKSSGRPEYLRRLESSYKPGQSVHEKYLYHTTTSEQARDQILEQGLKPDNQSMVYLSKYPIKTGRLKFTIKVQIPDNSKLADWRDMWGEFGDSDAHEYDPKNPYFIYEGIIPPKYLKAVK